MATHLPRQAISDVFTGVLVQVDPWYILVETAEANMETRLAGEIVVRYGVHYLSRPHMSIVPDLLALDYGDMLNGEAAWDFLFHQSNLYPRADVCGYRHDGVDEMVTVKQLDLMRPLTVFAYANISDVVPIAPVHALITQSISTLAPRLMAHAPIFSTWQEWQASQHEQ